MAASMCSAYAQSTLNLASGWNLLGNSSAAPIDVAATFGDASRITSVWKWNSATARWALYLPSMTPSALASYAQSKNYDVLTGIASKDGYWVNAATSAALPGPVANGVTLGADDLQSGWNLVSGANRATPARLHQSLGGCLNESGKVKWTAWTWDAANLKWKFHAPLLEAQGGTVLARSRERQPGTHACRNGRLLGRFVRHAAQDRPASWIRCLRKLFSSELRLYTSRRTNAGEAGPPALHRPRTHHATVATVELD